MANATPPSQPNQLDNGHTIFATLRDLLASLYPAADDARVAVHDAELDTSQIAFSNRAQTNWHNILAEAIRQERLDTLLQVVCADYSNNSALQTACEQYREFLEQGGHLEPPQQMFDNAIHIGSLSIPKPILWLLTIGLVIVVVLVGLLGSDVRNIYNFVTAPTPIPTATPLPFATQTVSETLIVVATFHNTAATNSEAHTKIRRAIAAEATNHNEQLRVEVEPTILTADQRIEAEALGNRYNASMVIWGEDTGVEVIVNFLNLREPDFAAAAATITEQERTQLANPSAYARFITQELPQTMGFLTLFAVGQSYYLNEQYGFAIERISAAVALVPSGATVEGLSNAYFLLGRFYQTSLPADFNIAVANYDQAINFDPAYVKAYNNRGLARADQGDLNGAIDDYNEAIRLDPDFAFAYNNRGLALADQGDLDGAIDDYTAAIRLDP
ncbi:MAG: tetratricopeptide repeat protein, partial [Caldilineaceae bacterium]|nr:tetratricopeptide repeat protein [Caldilineaceae bacterium]